MRVEPAHRNAALRQSCRAKALFLCFVALLSIQSHASPPKLIDVHVHFNGEPGVLEGLLRKLDQADALAILLVTPRALPEASTFIHKHPDRFAGFGDLKLDDSDALAQVERFHQAGLLGLGEITATRKNYDDPAYWPIYDLAARFHMILLFHTGIVNRLQPELSTDVSFERSRVTRLDLIARHWPSLILIGAHLGNPDYAEAAEVGRWNPNLYFDASGTTLLKKKNDYGFFKSVFWWSGIVSPHTPSASAGAFTKLVFGSDIFGGDLAEFDSTLANYRAMLRVCAVPAADQALIFSGTMWAILLRQQAAMAADTPIAGQTRSGETRPGESLLHGNQQQSQRESP